MPLLRGPAISDDTPDQALVALVIGGNSEPAFRTLYRRHSPRLFRMAVRLLGNEQDAEDTLQETWQRAVPRLGKFEWRSALGTWLASIAVNVAREALERRGRWVMTDLEADTIRIDTPDGLATLDLERAIATLPPGSRAVFVLHDVEGFTHDEIAAQLGVNAGTSKSQLFRARRALKRMLGTTEVEEKLHAL
jgi:RNA polymerase sigma factor (sigma-70 family)